MKINRLIVSASLLLVFVTSAQAQAAKAVLQDRDGKEAGTATLTEGAGEVKITLDLTGLPQGIHAFHIHETGTCEGPDFKSAGGHFNPYGKKHGVKNPAGSHAGDLPNVTIGLDGTGRAEAAAKGVTLGEGDNSLFHSGGTALVIHAGPDDEMTDPAGNAGARIACGVIQK